MEICIPWPGTCSSDVREASPLVSDERQEGTSEVLDALAEFLPSLAQLALGDPLLRFGEVAECGRQCVGKRVESGALTEFSEHLSRPLDDDALGLGQLRRLTGLGAVQGRVGLLRHTVPLVLFGSPLDSTYLVILV